MTAHRTLKRNTPKALERAELRLEIERGFADRGTESMSLWLDRERADALLSALSQESVRSEALEEAARAIEPASGLSEDGTLLIRKGQAAIRALQERQSPARVAEEVDSRSRLRRIAIQKGEPMPTFAPESPAKEQPGEQE